VLTALGLAVTVAMVVATLALEHTIQVRDAQAIGTTNVRVGKDNQPRAPPPSASPRGRTTLGGRCTTATL
jgi:hypothetical protein